MQRGSLHRRALSHGRAGNTQSHSLRAKRAQLKRRVTQRVIEGRDRLRRMKRTPRWVILCKKIYHQYGLKHLFLVSILITYQFLGAGMFYFLEAKADEDREQDWIKEISQNRTRLITRLIPGMFNNSDYLLFLSSEQTQEIRGMLNTSLTAYETQLGIKYTEQKIKWDFWNSMLYAGTLCTTIGYGHLYPQTVEGRLLTMVYAIFGIPLVLSILDDLGKLLTKCLKYPWYLVKKMCRRMFKYCTKQSIDEIRRIDAEDLRDLDVFDLPIPVAIFIVVLWIFICSATFCIWEHDWDYFLAFYFFFISLSTIGLGDITPHQPKYLLMLFGYIIIGLSLVSMCVNLIQAKLEHTYEAGREDLMESFRVRSRRQSHRATSPPNKEGFKIRRSTLGVIQRHSSYSLASSIGDSPRRKRPTCDKNCQTMLSIPSPKHMGRSGTIGGRVVPSTLSIDDVMRLVDTEEKDMIVCADFSSNMINDSLAVKSVTGHESSSDAETPTEVSQARLYSAMRQYSNNGNSRLYAAGRQQPLNQLERQEELEDTFILGKLALLEVEQEDDENSEMIASGSTPSIHFRQKLSIIPEHKEAEAYMLERMSPAEVSTSWQQGLTLMEEGNLHAIEDDDPSSPLTQNPPTSFLSRYKKKKSVLNSQQRKTSHQNEKGPPSSGTALESIKRKFSLW